MFTQRVTLSRLCSKHESKVFHTHRVTPSHPVSNQLVNQKFLFSRIFLFLVSVKVVVYELFDVKTK